MNSIEKEILDNVIQYPGPSLITCRLKKSWFINHLSEQHYNYLLSRFPDLPSPKNIPEILYRLSNNIETPPLCEICNSKPCQFNGFLHGYLKTCSYKCSLNYLANDTVMAVQEQITDDLIISHFIKDGKRVSTYSTILHCKQYGFYDYLDNRFPDLNVVDNLSEIIYRIYHKIEEAPICPICGKPTNYIRFDGGYRKYCSLACSRKSPEYYANKRKSRDKTNIEKWKNLGFKIEYDPEDHDNFIVYDKCPIHNPFTIKRSTFYNRFDNPDVELCPICNPERNSETSIEKTVKSFLNRHNISYVQHDRSAIKPRELDFYIPDLKLGIECNGIYWHHGEIGKERASVKYQLAKENNVNIITLWEDDLKHNKEKVKSLLLSKLGLANKKLKKPYLKLIDNQETESFMLTNSLRKPSYSDLSIGLFSGHTLYSIVSVKQDNNNLIIANYVDKLNFNSSNYFKDILAFINSNFQYEDLFYECFKETEDPLFFKQYRFEIVSEIPQDYSVYNYKVSKFRDKSITLDDKNSYKCYDAGKYLLKQIKNF